MDRNDKNGTKISGYLEKKGKNKMLSLYKKYWFVLEGGLLLYYRSKDDYETISPCKGSINLGPPCIVKPCPSMIGVFQIQTRMATVTLRAENRDEQNKWMQAIISEISPQKNLQRMSHFRYSMENVQQSKEKNPASTPDSGSSHNSNEDIIQRLQKMGAQSYNPKGTINKIATLKQKGHNALSDIQFEDNNLNNRNSKSSEHIYERISAEFKEDLLNEDKIINGVEAKCMTLPNQGFNTLRIKQEENRRNTFIIENDIYAISIQQKPQVQFPTNKPKNKEDKSKGEKSKDKKSKQKLKHTKSFFSKRTSKEEYIMVENEDYGIVQKENALCNDKEEFRDHNENNLPNGEASKSGEENAYSLLNFFDEANKKGHFEISNVEYAEPCLIQIQEQDKKKKTVEEEDKKKSKVKKKKNEEKIDEKKVDEKKIDEKKNKVKKRPSFIKRVWKKKEKKDKNEEKERSEENMDDEEIYETVPEAVVEKICVTDFTAVQMLSELQNILGNKMPLLLEKMSSEGLQSPTKDGSPEPVPELTKDKLQYNEMHMPQKIPGKKDVPLLPPKLKPDCHNTSCNKPIALPPKHSKKLENIKSLDEILDELDSQNPNSHTNKVKKLIKRFSEPEMLENDVVLRNKKNGNREEIDSGELSRLLEELAKVTSAPILAPGVTSSLNGANIPDEELSKLLPTKQRRFSEPDYDIPRPHKSLTILQKKDISENVIGSTRFFGPILKPSDMVVSSDRNSLDPVSQFNSITPDSLETNLHHPPSPIAFQEIDENPYSHTYYKFMDKRTFYKKNNLSYPPSAYGAYASPILERNSEDSFVIENDIYAEPRSISMNFKLSKVKNTDYEHDGEVFVDSLEVCKNEVSTEF